MSHYFLFQIDLIAFCAVYFPKYGAVITDHAFKFLRLPKVGKQKPVWGRESKDWILKVPLEV